MNKLEQAIGYTFKNGDVLQQALKHCSFEQKTSKLDDNERLEFLGDRVLNLVVASMVFKECPNDSEGDLAKRHAALVRQEKLAEIAEEWHLGEHLLLGHGEEQTGGRAKPSILSDAVESTIAAVYLDSGEQLDTVRGIIEKFWQPHILDVEIKDPKSMLQELVQVNGGALPEYILQEALGKSHEKLFTFEVKTEHHGSAVGSGHSKQEAQQNAARALLEKQE